MDKPQVFQVPQKVKSPMVHYFYCYRHRVIIRQYHKKVYKSTTPPQGDGVCCSFKVFVFGV